MARPRYQHYDGETESYSRSPSGSSPRQHRGEQQSTTSSFVKYSEQLAANYQEDIFSMRNALERSMKRTGKLLTDLQITERNRDHAFDQILEEMKENGLPTQAVEAVISRALVAPDQPSESLPPSKTIGKDNQELGRIFYYCILMPLVCCLWFGIFMAIRDGKLSWQTVAMVRKWLEIHWYAFVSCGQTEGCDRWQVVKSSLDLANARDRILWLL